MHQEQRWPGHILLDTRILNVAVTRAKAKLVIIGDMVSLSQDYASFMKLSSFIKESDFIKQTNDYIGFMIYETQSSLLAAFPCGGHRLHV